MIHWIILGTYLLGYVCCFRPIAWWILDVEHLSLEYITVEAIVLSILGGLLWSLLWPIFAVYRTANFLYTGREEKIIRLLTPRAHKRKVAEQLKEREMHEREQRIINMEHTLGLGRYEK